MDTITENQNFIDVQILIFDTMVLKRNYRRKKSKKEMK